MEDRIHIVFTDEEIAAINAALTVLKEKVMPKVITLSKKDRKKTSTMQEASLPFVTDALEAGKKEPKFVPPSVNIDNFGIDLTAYTTLRGFINDLNPIVTGIEDSMLLSGHEAYQCGRYIYNNTKQLAVEGFPGAKDTADLLGKRFKGQGNFGTDNGSGDSPAK